MADEETTLFNLKLGDTDGVFKTLDRVKAGVKELAGHFSKFRGEPSLTEATVGSRKELDEADRGVQKINKNFSNLFDLFKRRPDTSIVDPKKIEETGRRVEDLTKKTKFFSNIFSGSTRETVERANSLKKEIRALESSIESTTEKIKLNTQAQEDLYHQPEMVASLKEEQQALTQAHLEDVSALQAMKQELAEIEATGGGDRRGVSDRDIERITRVGARISSVAETFDKFSGIAGDAEINIGGFLTGLRDVVGASNEATISLTRFDEKGRELTEVYDRQNIKLKDLIKGVGKSSKTVEQTTRQFKDWTKQLESVQKNVDSFSEKISSWQKSIEATGRSGSLMKGSLGVASQSVGRFTSVLGGLATGLGYAGIAVAALQVSFSVLDEIGGTSAETIRRRIETIQEEIDRTEELNDLIERGSREAYEAQRQSILDQIRVLELERREYEMLGDEGRSFWDSVRTGFHDIIGREHEFGQTADEIRRVDEELQELQDRLNDFSESYIPAAIDRMEELNEVASEADRIVRDLERSEEDLLNSRLDIYNAQLELQQDIAEEQTRFDQETARLARERNEEDARAYYDHLQNLQGMRDDYEQRVVDLTRTHLQDLEDEQDKYYADLQQMAADHAEALAELDADFAEANTEALEMFNEEQLEDEEDHREKLAQMEEDFNKDRIKRQKDLAQQLFEAEIENDALRFFMLKREGEAAAEEAQEQYEEQVSEEQEAFEKAKQERLQAYEEERVERREQYEEQRTERIAEHEQAMRERHEQFVDSINQMKAAHQQRLQEEADLYAQQRAQEVQAFEERQRQQELDRTREDQDRQQRLEERRQELVETFEMELEYFRRRESILRDYINELQNIETGRDELRHALDDQVISMDEMTPELANLVRAERDRLEALEEQGTITPQEQARLNSLQLLVERLDSFAAHIATGMAAQDAHISLLPQDIAILSDTIGQAFDEMLIDVEAAFEPALQTQTPELEGAYDIYQTVGTGMNVADSILMGYESYLNRLELEAGEFGLQTEDEAETQAQRRRDLLSEQGDMTYQELQGQVEDQNQLIVGGWDQRYQEIETAQQQEQEQQQDHFYTQSQELEDFNTQQEAALGEGYDASLSQTQDFTQDQLNLNQEQNEELLGQQQELAQEELDLMTQQNEEELSQLDLFNQAMSDITVGSYRDILQKMLMTSQQGSAKIVSTYELMNTQIATSAAEALARIQSMMSSVGSKGGRRGTVGSAGGRGGTKGGRGGGRGGLVDKAGLFAAEGAFLTEPTELIAGELGGEIVMPFDESAGIPDDIMSKFGQGFYEGLENNLPMNRVNNADGGMREIIQALNNLQIGMNLTVQGVNIGSDISRQEIRNQFAQMQEAIVEIFDQSINAK